jgi:hypothetical protein
MLETKPFPILSMTARRSFCYLKALSLLDCRLSLVSQEECKNEGHSKVVSGRKMDEVDCPGDTTLESLEI